MSLLRIVHPYSPPAEARPELPRREIAGLSIAVATAEQAAGEIEAALAAGDHLPVAFANAHCGNLAYADPGYRALMGDFLVLADGIGIDIASRVLHGASFPENLNGTDFVPHLFATAGRSFRVALIGGAPGVADEAAARLAESYPRHEFRALSHGYFGPGMETQALLLRLRRMRPDVLLVALGVPRQERFIAEHITGREAGVAIGVGALFDFLSGRVPRAPERMRRLRLEWLFRLAIEPRRLWRRYVLGNPRFLAYLASEARTRRRRAVGA